MPVYRGLSGGFCVPESNPEMLAARGAASCHVHRPDYPFSGSRKKVRSKLGGNRLRRTYEEVPSTESLAPREHWSFHRSTQ